MSSKTLFIFILVVLESVEFISSELFTNTWAVEITGELDTAKQVAKEHGYDIVKKVWFYRTI